MASNNMLIRIGLKGVNTVISGLGKVGSAVAKTASIARSAGNQFVKMGAMVGVAFGAVALRQAMKFADSLREIQTIGKQSEQALADLGKELRLVSGEFGQEIGAVAKAQYDIISAGIKGTQNQMETLRASSALAVAGVSDVGTTADVITSAMNSYGQANLSASHASDVLFQTVEKGKTTIPELGASLGQVLPFASSAGMGLEMVGASMATITAGGVSSAEASTALKGAIIALDTPTRGAEKAMEKLGFATSRTKDGALDFQATMQDLAKLDPKSISKIIPNIRGQLAIKSIAKDMKGFNETVASFADVAGKTNEGVKAMNRSLGQQARMLKANVMSGFIELGTEIGEKLLPIITKMNTGLQSVGKIGWGEIASRVIGNFREIFSAVLLTLAVLWGRVGQIAKENFLPMLQKIGDIVLDWAGLVFEPILKYAKIIWLKVKQAFMIGINGIISLTNDMITLMNKLPAVQMATIDPIANSYQEQINLLMAQSTKIGEMFATGMESSESASTQIEGIWAGLKDKLFAMNEEQKADLKDLGKVAVDAENAKGQAISANTTLTKVANAESKKGFITTLSGLRSSIVGFLAQAIAKGIAKEAGKGIAGLVTGTVVAIGLTALFDKYIPKFAQGGQFVTGAGQPQLFMAGEGTSRERVTVEREDGGGFQGGQNVTVNISSPLVDETVRDSILPSIRDALSQELA